jgi:hypothetical protein
MRRCWRLTYPHFHVDSKKKKEPKKKKIIIVLFKELLQYKPKGTLVLPIRSAAFN